MKARVPVAVALIFLFTTFAIAITTIFFTRIIELSGEKTRTAEQELKQSANIRIDSVAGNKVYIRNIGNAVIQNTSLGFYLDGHLTSAHSKTETIGQYQIAEFTIDALPGTYELKVTGGKGSIATTTITII